VKKHSLKIRQLKSKAKCSPRQKESLKGLGLRRIGHTVTREDTPSLRGLIAKVRHLIQIVEE
jgi:large subunit ribosomal protein L30